MPIPQKTREKMAADPLYAFCAAYGQHRHICEGRITREHAIIVAGKKVQAEWAIPPICAKGHGVDQFQDAPGQIPKDMREWIALNRASDRDIQLAVGEASYSEISPFSKAAPYVQRRKALNAKYGVYVRQLPQPIAAQLMKSPAAEALHRGTNMILDNISQRNLPTMFVRATPVFYPLTHQDEAIIEKAKAQHVAAGGRAMTTNGMIAKIIREYGQTLEIIEAVAGEDSNKTP